MYVYWGWAEIGKSGLSISFRNTYMKVITKKKKKKSPSVFKNTLKNKNHK